MSVTSILKHSGLKIARMLIKMGILMAGPLLLLALLSYDMLDPSFNVSSDQPFENWLGASGAFIADWVMQIIGLAGFWVAGYACLLSLQYLFAYRLFSFRIQFFFMLLGGLLLPPALALSEPLAGGGLGEWAHTYLPWLSHWSARLGLCVSILTCGAFAARVSWSQLQTGCINAWIFLRFIGHILAHIWRKMYRSKSSQPCVKHTPIKHTPKMIGETPGSSEESVSMIHPKVDSIGRPQAKKPSNFLAFREEHLKKTATNQLEKSGGKRKELSLSLLTPIKQTCAPPSAQALKEGTHALIRVLGEFGIEGRILSAHPGPIITLYEFEPAPGIKSARVISLSDDIARSMGALSARISVIPGRNAMGIELPNTSRETVCLRDLLETKQFQETKASLPLTLGKDISGQPIIADLARMPHLLVAGTTGSGKSVGVNAMIVSLLYHLSPEKCQLLMVDPKMLELSIYQGIPHLIAPVITDPKKAVLGLKWAVKEMEHRYRMLSAASVRNIQGYNQKIKECVAAGKPLTRRVQTGFDEDGLAVFEEQKMPETPLPYIVVIVDEMADLMLVAGKEIEGTIQRLAQMARAAGIHLIMATQRPSVDVLTGTIKANFPSRISFQVTSQVDSRTILGEQGAEKLLGQGDMLYSAPGKKPLRVHGPFVSDSDVEAIVTHLKKAHPNYEPPVTFDPDAFDPLLPDTEEDDDLYGQALRIVQKDKRISTSYIQRKLQIGYNRAASLMEQLEERGVVSAPGPAGKRNLLKGNSA